MTKILQHPEFSKWFSGLRDKKGVAAIAQRLDRIALGNPGNVKPVGEGVSELKVDIGPGYRVYFVQRGAVLVVLLCGGDKSTQAKDIKRAKKLADELED
ncbi:addiction module antitoxin RelB [Pandoraea pneumonica]|uniref:Addiction module antitoxin RelB n=1 Tax=Pandoraea pneumonica TaxID=2508299 RepID=A0A5E4WSV6_9BURK|nr:type II toxin-antitoxin system RelE/ParE family toxin [Pandoraea pneumonica]VVE27852.1 addiction module antitoxin RelB [Pandoraea pneumonica]